MNRPLFHADTSAAFANGFLLFGSGGSLMARAFDPAKGAVSGEPVSLARRAINDSVTWHADVSASDTGVLVYGGTGPGSRQLVWLNKETYKQTAIAVDGLSTLFLARLSPKGDRIVLQKDKEGYDISVYDLRDKATTMSLPKAYSNGYPLWSSDGKWILYSSVRDKQFRIYRISADGEGKEQEVLKDDRWIVPHDSKGDTVLYLRSGPRNQWECWARSWKSGLQRKLLDSVDDCKISPDEKWLAYAVHENVPTSSSPGPLKVFVTDLATGQGKHQVSEDSGFGPLWSSDGKEIYYIEQSTLRIVKVAMRVAAGIPHFHVLNKSGPKILAEPIYELSPDNKHILIQHIPEPTVVVVTNFAEGLKS